MATASTTTARSPQTLLDDVAKYLPAPDVEAIKRAYTFAADAHALQRRESGEPYINHPLAVAETLASIHMDTATIVAALCHDVSEDCDVPMSELESRFGREVARLVVLIEMPLGAASIKLPLRGRATERDCGATRLRIPTKLRILNGLHRE
jgi:(p)ppGpp synthase/HD superfamily hydrolase